MVDSASPCDATGSMAQGTAGVMRSAQGGMEDTKGDLAWEIIERWISDDRVSA